MGHVESIDEDMHLPRKASPLRTFIGRRRREERTECRTLFGLNMYVDERNKN